MERRASVGLAESVHLVNFSLTSMGLTTLLPPNVESQGSFDDIQPIVSPGSLRLALFSGAHRRWRRLDP